MSTKSARDAAVPVLDPDAARAPVAPKRPFVTTVHGVQRIDDYHWMRERDAPEVAAYLAAENAYAAAVMKPTEPLQQALYDEILGHIKQTDLSVPYRFGDYFYYSATEEGKQYPVYARKHGSPEAPEEITLDLNALAQGKPFLGLGAYAIGDDGNLLAYSLDETGYRQYTLRVKDLGTGFDLPFAVERVGTVAWGGDRTLFYVTEDPVSKRHDKLFRHVLGSGVHELVYHEPDERFSLYVDRTRDRCFVLLVAASKSTTETRYVASERNHEPLEVFAPRREGHRYAVEHHGDRFFIVTNSDAEDFRIVAAPEEAPGEANWSDLVAERTGVHIDELDLFETFAVVRVRSGGFANLELLDLATHALRPVALPEMVHALGAAPNLEFGAGSYRFVYQSPVTPRSVFDLDPATADCVLLKETVVPGFERSAYATELQLATARDGTRIPISIVYRKGSGSDGAAPLLLYGYGSYGISIDPDFSPARLALIDRGVTFAIAHVRGGGELGEGWRTSGHLMHKLNTFNDFIACAEFLLAGGYASPEKLAIVGGSAGGLLTAAAANMRPDLFKAVVAQVPFVDVISSMLDASLPLTTIEYLEWGNPAERAAYDYMSLYSPYDNLRAQAYPAMLVKTSLNDSQVMYWEAAKYVAKLRTLKTDCNPLLLEVNLGAGHGGASGRYDALREIAFTYAFVLAELGATRRIT